MKAAPELLDQFLAMLPRALRAAFEFRHESWFSEAVYTVLRAHDAALCIAESDERTTPEIATARFSYYRLRRSDYSDAERAEKAKMLTAAGVGRDVYAFFKHEERPESPLWAMELLHSAEEKAA